jgi:hypothetical protein
MKVMGTLLWFMGIIVAIAKYTGWSIFFTIIFPPYAVWVVAEQLLKVMHII